MTVTEVIGVGHSNGGMMLYRLAIDHPDLLAGIFAMSADVMIPNPNTYTGRIKQIHGEDDGNVPLAGGYGVNGIYYTPVIPTVQQFTLVNGNYGVTASASLDTAFTTLPSPATHAVSSLKTALALSPYLTTLQEVIFNFVYQLGDYITTDDGDFIITDDGNYVVVG